MNFESHVLVDMTVKQVQDALAKGDQPAIAVLEGEPSRTLSNSAYLRDPARAEAFERQVAEEANHIDLERMILAVPQISSPETIDEETSVRLRSPYTGGPVLEDDGEMHVILWVLWDAEEGHESGMVPYRRKRDGTPVFDAFDGSDHIFSIPLNFGGGPGLVLLRELLDETLQRRRTHP
ncbi:hypothetical protein [Parafrankia sp. BMG5.11]|uniref:hypothetical protein n=1 Tax=Parafrankia sp. BMG5.11 TaxID=222540 RepID=UPI00103BDD96|nr:hypothetical protein [Parafrankia sp. BMG5.11]TCJ34681.1 hypothetical protein E0504_32330 [Parafrankia sp. BMG5.11]